MTRTACLLLLLAACSGGGGGGFTPSQNIQQSHPQLVGHWSCTAQSAVDPSTVLRMTFDVTDTGATSHFHVDVVVASSCFRDDGLFGDVLADGTRVLMHLNKLEVDAALSVVGSAQTLNGTYSVTTGPCTGDHGTVFCVNHGAAPALLVEDRYQFPDLDLFVLVERR